MIINNDSLHALKELEDNSIDLVATDPPYGYSFMGKDWDKAVPSVDIWKECLRVLKPGAFCFVMSAPRSDVQNAMISRLMEAGFRLDFTPIYWTYASGFPKAGNIGKLVDKRLGIEPTEIRKANLGMANNPQWNALNNQHIMPPRQTDQAKALEGSYAGYQPKPAVEVIIVAMKPLSEKTYVDQAMKNGKGITWLDDVRVPTNEEMKSTTMPVIVGSNNFADRKGADRAEYTPNTQGRFPANLLVSDDVLNDGTIRKSPSGTVNRKPRKGNVFTGNTSGFNSENNHTSGLGDSGSYSRYFDLDKWAKTLPFLIVPKASKREKNEGLDGMPDKLKLAHMRSANGAGEKNFDGGFPDTITKNHHPTVKPIKLMSYLITLGSRKGDTVLDPFVGSGTTAVAAKILGRVPIGIEREKEYAEIAQARLANAEEYVPVEDKQTRLV